MKKKINLFGKKAVGGAVKRKGKNKAAPSADKDFVRFKCYYADCNLIELKAGDYLALFEIEDTQKDSNAGGYKEQVAKLLITPTGVSSQFFMSGGKTYLVLRTKAELVDDAVEIFKTVTEALGDNELFTLKQVEVKEWFDLICGLTQFQDYTGETGVVKGKVKQAVQPVGRKVKAEHLELGERIGRTAILTNYPSEMFTGYMTELLEVSDSIRVSVYLDEIDKEHCLMALDTVTDMYDAKKQAIRGCLMRLQEKFYNCCALIYISGLPGEVERVYERVGELSRNYLVSVNPLEQQQVQGFLSVLPLCDNQIRCNKAIRETNVTGLLDFSWMKRLHSGICYGISELSGRELYFNRLMERESGYYLGSKAKESIRKEIDLISKQERVAVFTLGEANRREGVFCALAHNQILGDNPAVNREILRVLSYIKCGTNGNVSEKIKAVLYRALLPDENVMSYDGFLEALSGLSADLGKRMRDETYLRMMQGTEIVRQSGNLGVYKPLGSTQTEQFIQLMGGLANCKEDIIYILDGEVFAKMSDSCLIPELMKQSGKMITCMSGEDMVLLRNPVFKESMRTCGFLHISECDTLEKINVGAVLKLDKRQTSHLTGAGHSLLVTKYADYLLSAKDEGEKGNDEQGTNETT